MVHPYYLITGIIIFALILLYLITEKKAWIFIEQLILNQIVGEFLLGKSSGGNR